MWLCLSNAFFSIVSPSNLKSDEDVLLVRARRKGDIERIFPGSKVNRTPGRDYLYRAKISRTLVAETIAKHVTENVFYTNFKNSVENDELHDAYSAFWNIHSRLQEVPPYSTVARRDLFRR